MAKEYKPEFLTPRQRKFIRRHKKVLKILIALTALLLVISFVTPYVIDHVDMKLKESAVYGISRQLKEDIPGEWKESKRCVRNYGRMFEKQPPPTCYVETMAVFEAKSDSELQDLIHGIYKSVEGNSNITLQEIGSSRLYGELLNDISSKEQELVVYGGRIEAYVSQPFSVRWSPSGNCSLVLRLFKSRTESEAGRLLAQIECNKDSKFAYYKFSMY